MSVQQIKEAIQRLTIAERAEVAVCLHDCQDDAWDEQMKRDLSAGKLGKLLDEVEADILEGKLRDMS